MKQYLTWFTDRIGKVVLMTRPGQLTVEIKIESWIHARLLHEDHLLRSVKFEDK